METSMPRTEGAAVTPGETGQNCSSEESNLRRVARNKASYQMLRWRINLKTRGRRGRKADAVTAWRDKHYIKMLSELKVRLKSLSTGQ